MSLEIWILAVLIAIAIELNEIRRSLTAKDGDPHLADLLREIKDELAWFKNDNFAGQLLSQMKENCDTLEHQLKWFTDDNFAGHLLREIQETRDDLERALRDILDILQELKDTRDMEP